MIKSWDEEAWKDYIYWQDTDRKILKRINALIKAIDRDNYTGIGKPEPLKGDLQGYWSRRIDSEHRLIYAIRGDSIVIIACRYHYSSQ